MKFIVKPGCQLYTSLMAIKERMALCIQVTEKLWKDIKYPEIEGVSFPDDSVAGGIRAFKAKSFFTPTNPVPTGWKKMERGDSQWIFPKGKDSATLAYIETIKALPSVPLEELQKLLKYRGYFVCVNDSLCDSRLPRISWGKDFILLETPSDPNLDYKAITGMQEILESEYNKLHKKTGK